MLMVARRTRLRYWHWQRILLPRANNSCINFQHIVLIHAFLRFSNHTVFTYDIFLTTVGAFLFRFCHFFSSGVNVYDHPSNDFVSLCIPFNRYPIVRNKQSIFVACDDGCGDIQRAFRGFPHGMRVLQRQQKKNRNGTKYAKSLAWNNKFVKGNERELDFLFCLFPFFGSHPIPFRPTLTF